jgi:hypothetical protein
MATGMNSCCFADFLIMLMAVAGLVHEMTVDLE